MTKIISLFFILSSLNGFAASQVEGTPSYDTAKEIAFNYAIDHVFADILDAESSMTVSLKSEDQNRYVFEAKAEIAPKTCFVDVIVSKETGMAFNDDEMICYQE